MATKIEKLFAKLSAEDAQALRDLVAEQIKSQVAEKVELQTPGMTAVYNRCERDFEFSLDSRPHIVPANKIVSFPDDVAAFAIRKSAFKNVGRHDVKKWLVPYGDANFGIPLSDTEAGLTGDIVEDYPIPLGPSKYDDPRTMNKASKFSLDELPPRGIDEPPVTHRSGSADDAHVVARPDSL